MSASFSLSFSTRFRSGCLSSDESRSSGSRDATQQSQCRVIPPTGAAIGASQRAVAAAVSVFRVDGGSGVIGTLQGALRGGSGRDCVDPVRGSPVQRVADLERVGLRE